jgi:hypothetical protein
MAHFIFSKIAILSSVLLAGLPIVSAQTQGRNLNVHVQPVFLGKNIALDEPMRDQNGDSLTFHTFRFYLGNFVLLKNGAVVFEEKKYRLLDAAFENSLNLTFQIPEHLAFDQLQFDLGVDSLTNVSGAFGGDLDPTQGMYWTWQSGYINTKIEGFYPKCPARLHEFQFHLGGYLPPFPSVQTVTLPISEMKNLRVHVELAPFFEQVDWQKSHSIMSPGEAAMRMSKLLAKLFSIYAQ